MLVSLNWLRDFVDIPADVDAYALAERFTTTCAEVEKVIPLRRGEITPAETTCTQDDWVIEIDNKSITHRPDLWGHYGIAREMAAMLQLPLKALDVADGEALDNEKLPEIPIIIDDPSLCARYSGIMLSGLGAQSSPEWMQARLSHVGQRPISALVDLTNYVMIELGQPTHAFDGDMVTGIEVAVGEEGAEFTTLDGQLRKLPAGALMIQTGRRNVALAGVMGGLDTEVTASTTKMLLESASFDAATIRRCATALGHRTDASTRFEKSLDPALTVLAIARFVRLAADQFPDMTFETRLSDCFPEPPTPLSIDIDPSFVSTFIGKNISLAEMKTILEALEFKVNDHDDHIAVLVPSFRATKDIEGEADIIEEIARFVGYGNIDPVLPQATVRHFSPNGMHELEQDTLKVFCRAEGYFEIHDYIWYHDDWLKTLGYDPGASIVLRNPAASGLERLRHSVMPGLLKAAEANRRDQPNVRLLSLGSVFTPTVDSEDVRAFQRRHLGLMAIRRGRKAQDALLADVKNSVAKWAEHLFGTGVSFSTLAGGHRPWEDPQRAAEVLIAGAAVGRIATVPLPLRRSIDEHLSAWSMVAAEITLDDLAGRRPVAARLPAIPEHPEVDLDFSIVVDSARTYMTVRPELESFSHPLLKRLSYEGCYEGKSLPEGQRSLLLRARIGEARRTLREEDIKGFSTTFESFLADHDIALRQ